MKIINGKVIAERIKCELKDEITKIITDTGCRSPKLSTILVGEDPGSKTYVAMKQRDANLIGIENQVTHLSETVTESELSSIVKTLNNDDSVDGILIQLPLPLPHRLSQRVILDTIAPEKDVDGLTSLSGGLIMNHYENHLITCTPKGILQLLDEYGVPLSGANIVVVNHSSIVGRPLAQLLLNRGATVSVCHSRTRDLRQYTLMADVIITAVGKANLITSDMVKEGAVVIDAGYARINGKVCGDTDFEALIPKVKLITPPVGGVGPMTIAHLLTNTVMAWKKHFSL